MSRIGSHLARRLSTSRLKKILAHENFACIWKCCHTYNQGPESGPGSQRIDLTLIDLENTFSGNVMSCVKIGRVIEAQKTPSYKKEVI